MSSTNAAELPPGWTKTYDPRYKRFYYINSVLQSTQWEIPTEPARKKSISIKSSKTNKTAENFEKPGAATELKIPGSRTTLSSPGTSVHNISVNLSDTSDYKFNSPELEDDIVDDDIEDDIVEDNIVVEESSSGEKEERVLVNLNVSSTGVSTDWTMSDTGM